MTFPVSGVEVSPLVPPLVALAVSLFTSMGGVSGGFLLLPFQVSVLGFVSPAVSPTSLVYNLVAIPSGVYSYIREGRMVWPLMWVIIAGTVPGVCMGVILRIRLLPDPKAFKFFVGWVLLYIAGRLLYDVTARARERHAENKDIQARFAQRAKQAQRARYTWGRGDDVSAEFVVRTVSWSWRRITYRFYGETFSLSVLAVFPLALVVGAVSGVYGIGGGAVIGPLLVTIFRLPVYTVAGAVLMGTFISSIVGVVSYQMCGGALCGHGPGDCARLASGRTVRLGRRGRHLLRGTLAEALSRTGNQDHPVGPAAPLGRALHKWLMAVTDPVPR